MNAWFPVYQFEKAYEVNIIDGVVRRIVKDNNKLELPLPNVPIEVTKDNVTKFLGYGVILVDEQKNEHLLPIDKIVVESILKKSVNQKIYHKNNFLIDCHYKNLTLKPLPGRTEFVPATKEGKYYQYKAVKAMKDGKVCKFYVLDKVYETYDEFNSQTTLTIDDFMHDDEPTEKKCIGIYMWSTRDLGFEPLEPKHNSSLTQMAIA